MFDISQSIYEDGERNDERYDALHDSLIPAFVESPEGKAAGLECSRWVQMFLDFYFDYIGGSVSEISVHDVNEVVFELFPRKVSADPESAPEIVLELRAFFEFLGREYRLSQAKAIVEVLSDKAIAELQKELADSSNFGMAKSIFMQGQKAGFDMTTQEGMQQFISVYNDSMANRSVSLPDSRPMLTPAERHKKRKKSKAQRQARKRNRR